MIFKKQISLVEEKRHPVAKYLITEMLTVVNGLFDV